MSIQSSKVNWLLIGFAFTTGALLRLWSLPSRGLFYHDEAVTLGNGVYYGGLLRSFLNRLWEGTMSFTALAQDAQSLWEAGGTPSLYARSLHEGLVVAAAFLFGSKDTVGLAVSALAGILSIFVIARIRAPSFPPLTGPIASALLAFSVWHVHYSRAAVSMAVSLLIMVLLLKQFLELPASSPLSRTRIVFLGITCGLAFLSHYNLFWIPLLLGMWIARREWRTKESTKNWLSAMALLCFAMALPPLLLEGSFQIVKALAGAFAGAGDSASGLPVRTYFEQVHAQVFNIVEYEVRRSLSPLYFPATLLQLEGWPMAFTLLSGAAFLIYSAYKRNSAAVFLLLWMAIPYFLWNRFGYPGPRSYLPILPVLCLGAGALVGIVLENLNAREDYSRRLVLASVFILLMTLAAFQVFRLSPLMTAVSPWKEVGVKISELRANHGNLRVSDAEFSDFNRPLLRFYLKEAVDRINPESELLIIDFSHYHRRWWKSHRFDEVEGKIIPLFSSRRDPAQGMVMLDPFDPEFVGDYQSGKYRRGVDIYAPGPCGQDGTWTCEEVK